MTCTVHDMSVCVWGCVCVRRGIVHDLCVGVSLIVLPDFSHHAGSINRSGCSGTNHL